MTEGAFGWDKFVDNVIPRIPMRRWGQPEDFAAIAVYIMSEASGYHTSDNFLIDGGYSVF
jgi:NAD(P)-dependent dehydrogenase (short-subunit alcohol dehydrogenase family)